MNFDISPRATELISDKGLLPLVAPTAEAGWMRMGLGMKYEWVDTCGCCGEL